jgi:small-conductance mechanosensitive channel
VTYDSDLEKARKLIKQIGLELQQDPEFGPNIIEPLKMQGVPLLPCDVLDPLRWHRDHAIEQPASSREGPKVR